MGWWKKLKGWQKGGVLLGGLHMIFYGIGMILFGVTAGYFVIILELPWAFIIKSVGFQGDLMFFPFDLLVGTFFYASVGAVGCWVFKLAASIK